MKTRKLVYLAGPINGRTDSDCKDWRTLATEHLGAEHVLDPMRNDYRGRELEPGITQTIVDQDKTDIQVSSELLVYFDKPSVGTAMEILYAWQLGRPVFVVNVSGKVPSPWLAYHSQAIFPSLADALRAIDGRHRRLASGE
jgi:nucleoside 2-deoxyribosyltransferase